ncbi:MAG: hypothetical protein IH594_18575, partial [Bacteroidales bacterium]|nr:hypothetical protein [Bacteroidales bacterium]
MGSIITMNISLPYKRIGLMILSLVIINSAAICQLPVCSDYWVATDALGRKLPGIEEAGKEDDNSKQVGIFYWTWHTDNKADFSPVMNISQILEKYPEAAQDRDHFAWKNISGGVFWWEESIFGYYRTTDDWVLYKHAQMLANAKIDVVIFDATNGTQTWKSSYTRLLEVWNKARLYGMRVPKIAFMLGFSPNQYALTAIKELYHDLYEPELYPEMWYYWEGKPLIMAYYEMLEENSGEKNEDKLRQEIRNFFTFRPCQPDYVDGPSKNDQWNWLEIYPQNGYGLKPDGSYEEMSVGVAQNASKKSNGKWHAFNDDGTFGRSYTFSHGQDTSKNAFLKGLNFQEQWNRALEINPDFIFVTGWNEWTAGRHINYDLPTVKSYQPFAFVDQYNWEKSRDAEPVKAWGEHADNYYMQLIANIRKFKGLNTQNEAVSAVTKDGENHWSEYSDYRGDVMWRDHPGQGDSLFYTNQTGRNDINKCNVASVED